MPKFPITKDMDSLSFLTDLSKEGLLKDSINLLLVVSEIY